MIKRVKSGQFCWLLLLLVVSPLHAEIQVDDAYIRGLPPGQTVTAAFFHLSNQSDKSCELIGASSPVAGQAEIHAHSHHNGMMKMRRVDAVDLPAGETFVFKPGGYHLMLLGVQQPLVDGDNYPVTLFFRGCPEQTINAEVRSVLR